MPKQKELVTEQALYDVGLSSIRRLGLFFFSFLLFTFLSFLVLILC